MMKRAPFAHLHVHTTYSLLDGAIRIKDLVRRAAECNMGAVAITDHGNLFGAIEFYCAAREAGVKPILGYEAYLAPGSRFEKEASSAEGAASHLLLLAKDKTGYRNLLKLATAAYLEGFYYHPRVDRELLARHSGGLIGMSACVSGEVAHNVLCDNYSRAVESARGFQEIFGKENFFIEVMNHGLEEEKRSAAALVRLADEVGAPLVGTNDVHYLSREDVKAQDALLCINTGKLLSDTNRMRMGTDQLYFKDAAEMQRALADYPEAAANTLLVAEMCNVELELDVTHAPDFRAPDVQNNAAYLERLCREGAGRRFGTVTGAAEERLRRELGVIERMGYVSYFLIVWDFVRYAKSRGIPVGPGRGSGCGSLVAYCLGITEIDPLRHDILFERFMDEARREPPDIDIDFCQEGRDEVIRYVREKYGEENVAQIITFGTFAARGVIRDVGRVLDVPLARVDSVAKLVPEGVKVTLADAFEQSQELRDVREHDPQLAELFDIAERLEGLARHASTHAAGVVLADKPLTEYVPLAKTGDDVTTQFAMEWIEKVGLLKFDFLGLRTLTVIAKTIENIERTRGEKLDLAGAPLDDRKTFELFSRGETAGVFQSEKRGFRELLVRLEPDRFEDLVVMVALYRPGPLGGGLVDQFIDCKHGRKKPQYPAAEMEQLTASTYGVMVYQDQVMRILNAVADFPMNEALTLIKAISKKKQAFISSQEKVFVERAAARGIAERTSRELFAQIEAFAGYGFNKGHSTAYGLIAYQTAYLKANYPVEFMAGLLTCEMVSSEKVAEYVDECRRMGIEVLPPDVGVSVEAFTPHDGAIRFGLGGIKGIGHKAIEAIVGARERVGEFRSLFHFCENVDLHAVNRAAIETLIKSGAFDSVGGPRAALAAAIDKAIAGGSSRQSDRRKGQTSLFDALEEQGLGVPEDDRLAEVPEWPENQKLAYEKETVGVYLSSHPLARYEETLRAFSTHSVAELGELASNSEVVVGGWIESVRFKALRNGRQAGERMAVITFEDLSGTCSAVLFPSELQKWGELVDPHRIVFLAGRADLARQEPSIRVSRIVTLEDAPRELAGTVEVTLRCEAHGEETLANLGAVMRKHPGKSRVLLLFNEGGGRTSLYRVADALRVRADEGFLGEVEKIVGKGNVTLRGGATAGRREAPAGADADEENLEVRGADHG
ncbi:MAG: DNA polymerase III subunit alpha [Planctomycetota bacterium]